MKKKKIISVAIFREPNLDDRELSLFIIQKLVRMDADMRILRELILRQSESAQKKEDSNADLSKMSHFYFQQAMQEFEAEVESFRKRGNIDEN